MTKPCVLFGTPFSLYTGKARAYLIKQKIPYRELTPGTDHYYNSVLRAIHRWRMPVIEFPDGTFIQDSTIIIDHFEKQPGIESAMPLTPKQRIISLLFDVIGMEGLLRPAMHYRWNFPDDNDRFIQQSFLTLNPPWAKNPIAAAEKNMDLMRSACQDWGVVPEALAVVEELFMEFLDLLDQHFLQVPYLLGGKPSIGDFGLIAPFYGHLSRDPYPSSMIKRHAPRVFRWTERMNRTESDMGEFPAQTETFLENDEISDTLKAVLKKIGEDLVPESTAAAESINQWLADNDPATGDPVERGVSFGEFELRGSKITALAQPWRFFLLARMQKVFNELDDIPREEVLDLIRDLGLESLLTLTINREVKRHDNLEVWG
ncbi:MAG: glutathione S-transferase [Deltaproteobacteria bacterium]|nr:glutathione S-transferase [Deltaproteobacteria bacterium]MBW2364109.1 glutathione S-transferase [Deltaproteobacteria bacterium]